MHFQQLAELYQELEKTSSGNRMREIPSDFFKTVPTEDIAVISYLTLGQIASDYDDAVMGMADKSVLKAIAVAGAVDQSKVSKLMQVLSDSGLVAEKVLQKKPRHLCVRKNNARDRTSLTPP